jgi:hypothetical protein
MVMETLIGVRCIIGGCGEAKARSAELFLELFIRPQGIKNSFAVAEDFSIHSYQEIIFFRSSKFQLHHFTRHDPTHLLVAACRFDNHFFLTLVVIFVLFFNLLASF